MTLGESAQNLPRLRFLEFRDAGEWEYDQIGNIASITKGKGLSKADLAEEGETPCIRYAELYTLYGEVIHEIVSSTNVPEESLVLSQAHDIIIPASGETKQDIARAACICPKRVALGGDINILRSNLHGPFFSYALNGPLRHTVARFAQGDTVAHLYSKQISQVNLAYPAWSEQQKIADCLLSIDELIGAQEQKIHLLRDYKKGLMQQLFPREGETVPRLRFPEFSDAGEWEPKPLGSLGTFMRGLTYRSNDVAEQGLAVLRSSNIQDGKLILDSDLVHIGKDCPPNLLLREGDVAICMSNGSKVLVGKSADYNGGYLGNVTVGAFCSIFRTSMEFAKTAFRTLQYKEFISREVSGGNINNLKNSDLEEFIFHVPANKYEQQKIVGYLSSIHKLTETQEQKLHALRDHKKGLMQQLFPVH